MIVELGPTTRVKSWCSIGRGREDARRRSKGLRARQAFLQSREVYIPRYMYGLWVLLPVSVHFLRIVGVGAIRERVIWRRRVRRSRKVTEASG